MAALAIPGVGPLAAAGAIAASAIPTAAGVGAAVGATGGATGGAIARMFSDHDVDGKDAEFYEGRINEGGIFVSVDTRVAEGTSETARAVLERCGGHTPARAMTE